MPLQVTQTASIEPLLVILSELSMQLIRFEFKDLLSGIVCSVTFLQHFTGAPRAADPSKDACAGFFHSALLYILYTSFVFQCVVSLFFLLYCAMLYKYYIITWLYILYCKSLPCFSLLMITPS